MAHRFATAALALGTLLAVAPTSWAGPKDEKSARDDDAPKKFDPKHAEPKKAGPREGGELAERLERLEGQVRELTNVVKHRLAGEGKGPDHARPPDKGHPEKPHPEKVAAKGEPRPDGDKKPGEKGPHPDKAAVAKGEPKGERKSEGKPGGIQLVKGKDGQLLVPLSALPPGIQKELLARAGHEPGEGKGGGDKFEAKPKKGQGDDDKPTPKKFGAEDRERKEK